MSWRDQYRQGSFRGVPFKTASHDASGGRRGALHEFPQRDLPYFEDLGRLAKSYNIECLVLGDDYYAQRDALIAALDASGPGLLIHPYLGEIMVAGPQYNVTESSAEGGIARFTISFIEAGRAQAGEGIEDSALVSRTLADEVGEDAIGQFDDRYSLDGMPSYVDEAMADYIGDLIDNSRNVASLQGGAGAALDRYQAGLDQIGDIITLVRSPITLAENVRTLIRSVAGMAVLPINRLRALAALFDTPDRFDIILGNTNIRNRQRANQFAIADFIHEVTSAEAVRAISDYRFSSFDEAQDIRNIWASRFDDAALLAADRGEDRHSETLDVLRRSMVRDVNMRSATLARLFIYSPMKVEPALVIANRIYGASDVDARAMEIVERNHIPNPAFISGPIELRTQIEDDR